jgi:ABC-2 type transport system permease protein
MTAVAVSAPERGSSFGSGTLAVATRTFRKYFRTPQLVVLGTVQGAMFLLIFRYVFGGAIGSGSLSYVDFVVPGFVVTGVLFIGMGAAGGVAEDMEQGFFDRLRSLPMPRASVIAGRSLADAGVLAWGTAITTAIGFAIGFRLHASLPVALGAFGLCVLYGIAFGFVFIFLGLVAGNAQAAQGMSLMVFPLSFVSSAYVPVKTMPSWMQIFARNQPLTFMSDAVRGLADGARSQALIGQSTSHCVVMSLIWVAGILAVFGPLAVVKFSRR